MQDKRRLESRLLRHKSPRELLPCGTPSVEVYVNRFRDRRTASASRPAKCRNTEEECEHHKNHQDDCDAPASP